MRLLQLYIHTPFCVKKCDYCDFLSFAADVKTQAQYVNALIEEIRFYGNKYKDYVVPTIYIGGGTPSWLDAEQITAILSQVYESFQVQHNAEISIECNPGTVTEGKFKAYAEIGINRISIGLQSANKEELKVLGRIHSYEQFLKTYELARNTGFYNVNVDLMSGLPYQTAEIFANTLQKVIRLKPEHISAYSLIVEKGTPFYERYKFDVVKQEAGMPTEILPSEDEAYRIYKLTQLVLKKSGYHQYEISNYAKPGFECLHNIGYWTRENYLGLGLGAASLVDNVRYSNTRELYPYMEGMDNPLELRVEQDILTRKAQMEEFMFLGLRLTAGVSRTDFESCFGVSIESVYRPVLEMLRREKLLDMNAGRIFLTDKGMDLANFCMAQFMQ